MGNENHHSNVHPIETSQTTDLHWSEKKGSHSSDCPIPDCTTRYYEFNASKLIHS